MNRIRNRKRFLLAAASALALTLFFLFVGVPFSRVDDLVLRDQDFLKDLCATFLLTFTVIAYISTLNRYLDGRLSWNQTIRKRMAIQLGAGVLLPCLFIWLYIYFYRSVALGMHVREMGQFSSTDFPVAVLVVLFLNLFFAGYFFYEENRRKHATVQTLQQELFTLKNISGARTTQENEKNQVAEARATEEMAPKTKIRILVAVLGNKNIPIRVEDIAYVYKQRQHIELKTFAGDTYLLNHTLEELLQLLDEEQFFRANRQFIVNLKACQFFTNEENGKLALHLVPAHDDDVIISQKRAQAFKDWLHKHG